MSNSPDLLRATDERLWDLIRQRLRDDTDTDQIDEMIWHLFGERWSVVFTDLAGFSRNADKFGITHFLQVIYRHRELLYPIIREWGGILVKEEADSLLLLFRTPHRAIECCIDMQQACHNANRRLVAEEQIHLCVGIGVGDILRIGDHDVWGREVNASSKLGEDTAEAGEILITRAVIDDFGGAMVYEVEELEGSVAGSSQNYRVLYQAKSQ